MAHRKTGGDEQMKRKMASRARRHGKLPSEVGATTGAPQQRKHLRHKADHEERLEARHRGQQSSGWRPTA
jgi:hypothetical protein